LIAPSVIVALLNELKNYALSYAAPDDNTIIVEFQSLSNITIAQLLAVIIDITNVAPDKVTLDNNTLTLAWTPPQ
jgi:hypothetical protein